MVFFTSRAKISVWLWMLGKRISPPFGCNSHRFIAFETRFTKRWNSKHTFININLQNPENFSLTAKISTLSSGTPMCMQTTNKFNICFTRLFIWPHSSAGHKKYPISGIFFGFDMVTLVFFGWLSENYDNFNYLGFIALMSRGQIRLAYRIIQMARSHSISLTSKLRTWKIRSSLSSRGRLSNCGESKVNQSMVFYNSWYYEGYCLIVKLIFRKFFILFFDYMAL